MLKGNRKYIFFLVVCFASLVFLQVVAPKPVDRKLSYMKKDKIPYGASALYEMLPFFFPGKKILTNDLTLFNALKGKPYKQAVFMIINEQFEPDKLDVRELINFVKAGNTAFISANYFSGEFMDTLKFEMDMFFNPPAIMRRDTAANQKKHGFEQFTKLDLYNPLLRSREGYSFEIMQNSYFSNFDTARSILLGSIRQEKINYIKIPFGKGYFYLHSTPEAFVNLNFLKQGNSEYAGKTFAYLKPGSIIWDNYYKAGKVPDDNRLHVILSHAPLTTAYYLLLFSLVTFILIGIKRKQRIIPVIEPLNNTTLDFIHTVGTLYYQQGMHKQIAEKQIIYFIAAVRSMFRLGPSEDEEAFITRLSDISGVERDKVKALIRYFAYIRSRDRIYEQELFQLNKMIEDFYNLNKRRTVY